MTKSAYAIPQPPGRVKPDGKAPTTAHALALTPVGISIACRVLAVIVIVIASGAFAALSPALQTDFEGTRFTDPHRLDLPLKNWFEFAARHREDGGKGSGEGGASARIAEGEGRDGGRALALEVSDITKSRRAEFNVWPPADTANEFSVSVWLKLPEDFALRAPGIDWNWMEFCVLGSELIESPRGRRWSYLRLTIDHPDPDRPVFHLALGGRRGNDHAQYLLGKVNDFPLPRGRWFNVHYCLKRNPSAGAVKVWVDGRLIFDLRDIPTTEAGTDFKISPAKLYYERTDTHPKEMLVDDLTIWPGWVELAGQNNAPQVWRRLSLRGRMRNRLPERAGCRGLQVRVLSSAVTPSP